MARLGASNLERSICGPQLFTLMGVTGGAASDPEHLPDAELVVVWGMDPVSTSIHTWELIRQARKRNGARLVVVDPYVSRTARYADVHLRPHPGTDGALALAVAHVIFRDDLARPRRRLAAHDRRRRVPRGRGAVDARACGRRDRASRPSRSRRSPTIYAAASPVGDPHRRRHAARGRRRAAPCGRSSASRRSPASGSTPPAATTSPCRSAWPTSARLTRRDLAPAGTRDDQHDPARPGAHRPRPRPARARPVRVEQQPGGDRRRPAARARRTAPRRPVHGGPRAVPHGHGPARRHRAARRRRCSRRRTSSARGGSRTCRGTRRRSPRSGRACRTPSCAGAWPPASGSTSRCSRAGDHELMELALASPALTDAGHHAGEPAARRLHPGRAHRSGRRPTPGARSPSPTTRRHGARAPPGRRVPAAGERPVRRVRIRSVC